MKATELLPYIPGLLVGGIFVQVFWRLFINPRWTLGNAAVALTGGTVIGLAILVIIHLLRR